MNDSEIFLQWKKIVAKGNLIETLEFLIKIDDFLEGETIAYIFQRIIDSKDESSNFQILFLEILDLNNYIKFTQIVNNNYDGTDLEALHGAYERLYFMFLRETLDENSNLGFKQLMQINHLENIEFMFSNKINVHFILHYLGILLGMTNPKLVRTNNERISKYLYRLIDILGNRREIRDLFDLLGHINRGGTSGSFPDPWGHY